MTNDERLERVIESQERPDTAQDNTQVMLAGMADRLRRLERIALSHLRVQDLDAALVALEIKSRRPQ